MNSDDLYRLQGFPGHMSSRAKTLDYLWRSYHSKQYDVLQYCFDDERMPATGKYIPLHERRPSIRFPLGRIVVKKSVSMLFAGRNWPQISTDSQTFTNWLDIFSQKFRLPIFSLRVATRGSIGTVVPVFRYNPDTKNLTFDVWNARDTIPVFGPDGDLESVMLRYLTTADALRMQGFEINDKIPRDTKMWYRRKVDKIDDQVFTPTLEGDWDELNPKVSAKLKRIDKFSLKHDYGMFVPACWVRNLPSEEYDDALIDGSSTFSHVLDFQIGIDYILSQVGRSLRYSADPNLVTRKRIQDMQVMFGVSEVPRSVSQEIEVEDGGDAKLLEINGQGQKISLDYADKLRNYGLESVRGSRKDPQRAMSHAQSGKLAEMMEDEPISLNAELRHAYGNDFLLPFYRKIVSAFVICGVGGSIITEDIVSSPEVVNSMRLSWGPWFEYTSNDHLQLQQALDISVDSTRMDTETARRITYASHGMLVPKDVDWLEQEKLIALREEAKNLWRIKQTELQVQAQQAKAAQAEKDKAAAAKASGVASKTSTTKAKKSSSSSSSSTPPQIKGVDRLDTDLEYDIQDVTGDSSATDTNPDIEDVFDITDVQRVGVVGSARTGE